MAVDFSNLVVMYSGIPWEEVGYTLLTIIIALVASKIIFVFIKGTLEKIAGKTKTTLDDILVKEMETPTHLFVVLLALYLSLTIYPGMQRYFTQFDILIQILLIFVVAYGVTKAVTATVRWYMHEKRGKKYKYNYLIVVKKIINAVVYILAIIIVLSQLGIEVTPLITSLGIGGLAVALAFQDTLENYFAGIYVSTDKGLEVGDYIQLSEGIAGTIKEIDWRTTKIQTWDGNLVIIPNSKLAESTITNYFKPSSSLLVPIDVPISYNIKSDKAIREIKRLVSNVKKKAPDVLDKNFEVIVKIDSFGESNIIYKVIVKVTNRSNMFKFKELFNAELARAYDSGKLAVDYNIVKVL
ncbi:MAG: mechanosensitive ion channel family protein [Candidatus Diapherotrites archaeon]|nr:mechanosensitive ion channel family protein [Candidatus Diapherotrites archaeon]